MCREGRLPGLPAVQRIMVLSSFPQPSGRAFRCDVALRSGEHLIADHELPDRSGAKQWRIEVSMQMPLVMGLSIGRTLMESHRVRERTLEKVVVANCDTVQNIGERPAL